MTVFLLFRSKNIVQAAFYEVADLFGEYGCVSSKNPKLIACYCQKKADSEFPNLTFYTQNYKVVVQPKDYFIKDDKMVNFSFSLKPSLRI